MLFLFIILFLNICLNNCFKIDTNFDFKRLYEKFQTDCQSVSEVKIIENLFRINDEINSSENEFKSRINGSELDSKALSKLISSNVFKVLNVVNIRTLLDSAREGTSTSISCMGCDLLMSIVFNTWIPMQIISDVMINVCLGIYSRDVCEGYVGLFRSPLQYIRHNTNLKTQEICCIILGVQCFSGAPEDSSNLFWKIDIKKRNSFKSKKPLNNKHLKSDAIKRILHITDIHLDRHYVPLTVKECGKPYCCRPTNHTVVETPEAGYWGSYHCDTPLPLFYNLFESIDWPTIDFVYWTGDVGAHNTWEDRKEQSISDSRIISNELKKYNKPIVTAIGNHISIPVGTFAPPDISNHLSISWLYNELANELSVWLTPDALKSLRFGGYYVLQLTPGLRVIVLNTNYCARLNIWTLYRSIDPSDQLKWLSYQLGLAEEAGDSVHIVGHIPPDNRECTQSWLYNYMAIIERYSDIIEGQFYGHTHYDEFRVLRSNHDCNKVIGVEIITPSVSPYNSEVRLNPAYRVIKIRERGVIEDMDTYTLDLSGANGQNISSPKWTFEYSMSKEYSIHLNNNGMNELIESISRDNYYLQLFYSHYTRISDENNRYCDNDCKQNILNDTIICNAFKSIPKPITSVG